MILSLIYRINRIHSSSLYHIPCRFISRTGGKRDDLVLDRDSFRICLYVGISGDFLQILMKFLTGSLKQRIGVAGCPCGVGGDNLVTVIFLRRKNPEIFTLLIGRIILGKILKLGKH